MMIDEAGLKNVLDVLGNLHRQSYGIYTPV